MRARPYRRLRRFAKRRLNHRGRRLAALSHRGVDFAGDITDRFHDRRQNWSILTAWVGDLREISELAMRPWELGGFDRSGIPTFDAAFVADPFLFDHDGRWYLFFEAWDRAEARGIIAVASSGDGQRWSWLGEALRESFHLSYPNVFEAGGHIYMVPESHEAGAVRLYEAVDFPLGWSYVGDLFAHPTAVDPTLFCHGGRWWCYLDSTLRCSALELYSVAGLAVGDEWAPHRASPLLGDEPVRARPAGRPVILDGQLHRLSQSGSPRYGTVVRAHRIHELTPDRYVEDRWGVVLLHPSGRGRNRGGSHHLSTGQRAGESTLLVAFDGY